MNRGRGRPRKEQTQTPEERRAYMRAYTKRPEVQAKRREYERRKRAEETPEEREERLAYLRLYKAAQREERRR